MRRGKEVILVASFFFGCYWLQKEIEMEEYRLRGAAERLKGEGVKDNGGIRSA